MSLSMHMSYHNTREKYNVFEIRLKTLQCLSFVHTSQSQSLKPLTARQFLGKGELLGSLEKHLHAGYISEQIVMNVCVHNYINLNRF